MTLSPTLFVGASLIGAATLFVSEAGSVHAAPARGAAAEPVCVALVLPSVTGVDGDATTMAQSLRDLLTSYLAGPSLAPVNLDAKLAEQAVLEAKTKNCPNVVVTAFTRKHSGGGSLGKVLGQAAETAAYYVPYGSTAASGAARAAAIGGTYAVSNMADSTRAKDELTVEYRVGSPDTVLKAVARKESLKAKADREDLTTPLVERVATGVFRQIK